MKPEIFKNEGYQLMGAAFEVYHDRGYGMAEEIYQESLEIELDIRGIAYQAEREFICFYKGKELKRKYVQDIVVFNSLVVELKAATQLVSDHEAQLINYLRVCRQAVGYLINYGHKDTLEWKRLIISEFISSNLSAPISED
jgi:GxxExxY protein